MAVDFKGEGRDASIVLLRHRLLPFIFVALTFKATTDGVIHNLAFSIELMQKREEAWRRKYEKVATLRTMQPPGE